MTSYLVPLRVLLQVLVPVLIWVLQVDMEWKISNSKSYLFGFYEIPGSDDGSDAGSPVGSGSDAGSAPGSGSLLGSAKDK